MKFPRRRFLHLAAGAAALPAVSSIARAQTYPTRAVRILVGFPAGGTTDIAARLVAQALSERLGEQFIVENRPGANTNIAMEAVGRAPAGGYTLLAMGSTNTINASLYDKLNFNLNRDFTFVAGMMQSPLVLEVHPSIPARAVPEFVTYVKANPGKISLASYGTGSLSHVAGELFKMAAGLDMVHVPYRGSAPMLTDMLGGHVQASFDNLPASVESIRNGQLRALAVTTAKRSAALPEIPAMSESLPGYETSAFAGICAPKGTPVEIIEKLNIGINSAIADPKVLARLADLGGTPLVMSSTDFGKFVANDIEKWAKVIRAANIKME
jgi:tripartite-type tricarboxylate transporter receptor subunit TctC